MIWVFLTACIARQSSGVILYSTGDSSVNTTAPTGTLAGSGWQFAGQWGNFLGTVISSNCFITAFHVGGNVGEAFHYNGVDYVAAQAYADPTSDLQIWRVNGTFPTAAPLYTAQNEINKSLMVIGRGTQRGAEVRMNGELKGWMWGTQDGAQRWGQNKVASLIIEGSPGYPSGVRGGDFIRATFDANGGANECHLSTGDSGGPLFIQLNGTWALAGISYSVDGPYNTTDSGPGFNAAIFDASGLYETSDGTTWTQNLDLFTKPGAFYATRISTRTSWIQGALQSAASAGSTPVLESSPQVQVGFSDEASAAVDTDAKQFTVPLPASPRFYRLRASASLRITGINVNGGQLLIHYQ